jgi:hypothetical protein
VRGWPTGSPPVVLGLTVLQGNVSLALFAEICRLDAL